MRESGDDVSWKNGMIGPLGEVNSESFYYTCLSSVRDISTDLELLAASLHYFAMLAPVILSDRIALNARELS